MTAKNNSFDWKESVTLKEHFQALMSGLELRIEQARITMEKRLDSMNEFRDALRNQSDNSPTRNELTTAINAVKAELIAEIEALKKDIRNFNVFKEERASVPSDLDNLKKDMKILNSFKDNMQGKASQSSVAALTIMTVLSLLLTVVSLLLRLIGI